MCVVCVLGGRGGGKGEGGGGKGEATHAVDHWNGCARCGRGQAKWVGKANSRKLKGT